ncbi:MAG: peptide-methionine (S)-S-oxide reductase MsrA [Acidobacteriota bacterium]
MKYILIVIVASLSFACALGAAKTSELTEVVAVEPSTATRQTAVFAGGCFWGVEAVFEHVKGVTDVKSGYAGGKKEAANYDDVSTSTTGHAESVLVTFDPSKVTYTQLLSVFFSVAHDPTQLNKQGPDHGTQYRSVIFFVDESQKHLAKAYIDAISKSKAFPAPVVTQVAPLDQFYPAETYHQDYLKNHPDEPYIVINDKPKVEALKAKFPDLYVE